MNFYIYKYIENGEIAYIGQTTDLLSRINQHKFDKLKNLTEIWYFECNNQTEMDSYEFFLIRKYRPKFNVIYNKEYRIKNDITIMDFIEPNWKKWESNQLIDKTSKKIEKKSNIKLKDLDYSIFKSKNYTYTTTDISYLPSLLEQKIIIFSYLNNNIFNLKKFIEFNQMSHSMYKSILQGLENLKQKNIFTQNNENFVLNTNIFEINLPKKFLYLIFNSNTKYFFPVLNASYSKESNSFYISMDWLLKNTNYSERKDCGKRVIKPICELLEINKIKFLLNIERKERRLYSYTITLQEKGE